MYNIRTCSACVGTLSYIFTSIASPVHCGIYEEVNQTKCICEHISFTQIKSEADRSKNKNKIIKVYRTHYTLQDCVKSIRLLNSKCRLFDFV